MSRICVKDLPKKLKEKELREHFDSIDSVTECSLRFDAKGGFRRFAFVGFKSKDAGEKAIKQLNNSFIGMTKIKVELARDLKENKPRRGSSRKKSQRADQKNSKFKNDDAPPKELILQTGRLFVRNLSYSCKAEDIENLFASYGKSEVHLVTNRVSKSNIGTCFVRFSVPEEAMKAFEELDGTDFQGRLLHIMAALPQKEEPGEAKTWKKKREDKKTPKAKSWNTLFVSLNAATDIISQRLKISKSDLILNAGKDSVAARISLGEAQVVTEIKDFLVANGVAIDSFGQADGPRSKTVILVKHLNAFTTEDSLRKIFERYGTIVRLVLPPCGVSALVEFDEPNAAKMAFERLDNQTVDHTIMFLEWAPMNVFLKLPKTKSDLKEEEDEDDVKMSDTAEKNPKSLKTTKEKTEKKGTKKKSTKFILKNVDFRATEKDIKGLFRAHQGLKSVRLPKKLPGSGPERHRGFAFVEFLTPEQAECAFNDLCMDCHLYKRRLNFEWTSAEESVEMLRKRTAENYGGETKKFKKSELLSELNSNS